MVKSIRMTHVESKHRKIRKLEITPKKLNFQDWKFIDIKKNNLSFDSFDYDECLPWTNGNYLKYTDETSLFTQVVRKGYKDSFIREITTQ